MGPVRLRTRPRRRCSQAAPRQRQHPHHLHRRRATGQAPKAASRAPSAKTSSSTASEEWQDNIKVIDELGGPKHFNHFPAAWAHAMNTPFQWTKQVASHFGGTRNPTIIPLAYRIQDKGGVRPQFLHIIDIVPTLYEPTASLRRETERSTAEADRATSFAFTFDDAKAPSHRKTQYFELGCNRGLYHDGWTASSPSFVPWDPNRGDWDPDKATWELYKVDEDYSQANDLAQKNPEKLRELQDLGGSNAGNIRRPPARLARRNPLQLRSSWRRPSLTAGRTTMTYIPAPLAYPTPPHLQ